MLSRIFSFYAGVAAGTTAGEPPQTAYFFRCEDIFRFISLPNPFDASKSSNADGLNFFSNKLKSSGSSAVKYSRNEKGRSSKSNILPTTYLPVCDFNSNEDDPVTMNFMLVVSKRYFNFWPPSAAY